MNISQDNRWRETNSPSLDELQYGDRRNGLADRIRHHRRRSINAKPAADACPTARVFEQDTRGCRHEISNSWCLRCCGERVRFDSARHTARRLPVIHARPTPPLGDGTFGGVSMVVVQEVEESRVHDLVLPEAQSGEVDGLQRVSLAMRHARSGRSRLPIASSGPTRHGCC